MDSIAAIAVESASAPTPGASSNAMVAREDVCSPAIIVVGEVVDLSDAEDKLASYARVAETMA